MAPVVHRFDWPDRFVVGTVGEPGSRTFFLQARTQRKVVSVALEKEQSAALAIRIDEVLDELMDTKGNRFSVPAVTASELDDDDPLDTPVTEQFRAGPISLGWDPATAQIVIEVFSQVAETELTDLTDLDSAELEPDEILLVRIPVGTARAFSKRAHDIIAAGRPRCPLCAQPMDNTQPDHVCEAPDGFGDFD